MKYLKTDKGEFLENGRSKVKVVELFKMPSPLQPGRIVKVLEVVDVLRYNPENPIARGHTLCMSFPSEKLNAKEYEWCKTGEWEETSVPYTLNTPLKTVVKNY